MRRRPLARNLPGTPPFLLSLMFQAESILWVQCGTSGRRDFIPVSPRSVSVVLSRLTFQIATVSLWNIEIVTSEIASRQGRWSQVAVVSWTLRKPPAGRRALLGGLWPLQPTPLSEPCLSVCKVRVIVTPASGLRAVCVHEPCGMLSVYHIMTSRWN